MIGHMDVYGGLSVDDLLDLPTDDFLSSDSVPDCLPSSSAPNYLVQPSIPRHSDTLSDILCVPVPAEDAAELEWLSNYMDDSFADYPENSLAAAENHVTICKDEEEEEEEEENRAKVIITSNGGNTTERGEVARRCTHCASEKTPQWRTGPLGPKTLCNACGVRYKSGRLVPEYRPAASPTFVLTQHSNSHRKVLELRRQKEMLHQQQQQEAAYGRHFRVC